MKIEKMGQVGPKGQKSPNIFSDASSSYQKEKNKRC